MILEFEIQDLPKMTNTLRVHWSTKMKEASKWKHLVCVAVNGDWNERKIDAPPPLMKAKLTLTRCSSREADFDGLVSSFKHVIDGLKEAGVIIDDKASVIGQSNYAWEYAGPRQGKIRVKVEAA